MGVEVEMQEMCPRLGEYICVAIDGADGMTALPLLLEDSGSACGPVTCVALNNGLSKNDSSSGLAPFLESSDAKAVRH